MRRVEEDDVVYGGECDVGVRGDVCVFDEIGEGVVDECGGGWGGRGKVEMVFGRRRGVRRGDGDVGEEF